MQEKEQHKKEHPKSRIRRVVEVLGDILPYSIFAAISERYYGNTRRMRGYSSTDYNWDDDRGASRMVAQEEREERGRETERQERESDREKIQAEREQAADEWQKREHDQRWGDDCHNPWHSHGGW